MPAEGMKSRVYFAPMGSDIRDPAVWRFMGYVKTPTPPGVRPLTGPVYCLARIDPAAPGEEETDEASDPGGE